MTDRGNIMEIVQQIVNRDEYIVLGVEGGLGWREAEREEFVDFGDESEVITVDLAEGDKV